MNNDKEMLEALLAGKTLTYDNGGDVYTYALIADTNNLHSSCNGKTCERVLLDIATNLWKVRPETIFINGIEVPKPEQKCLEMSQRYYVPDLDGSDDPTHSSTWYNDEIDLLWLSRGLIHLTLENALAHANALLSFTITEGKF